MMRINGLRSYESKSFGPNVKRNDANYLAYTQSPYDSVSFTNVKKAAPAISMTREANVLRIAFGQKLNNPMPELTTGIQMKVRGVTVHQQGGLTTDKTDDSNITELANSPWKDGDKLHYRIYKDPGRGNFIELSHPVYGELGRVPDEISDTIIKLIERGCGAKQSEEPQGKVGKSIDKSKTRSRSKEADPRKLGDFRFELSNVIAGTTKGAPTIGLRVNLRYVGKDPQIKKDVSNVFNQLLNSESSDVRGLVMLHQTPTSPDEVLQRIFDIAGANNNEKEVKKIKYTIENIIKEIDDPENKKILMIGHIKPDGDTLGSIIGMQSAITAAYPDKEVDCTVDDKIPGLFREKMPGIENVKRPYSLERIELLKKSIAELQDKKQTEATRTQIAQLEKEIEESTNPDNLFDSAPLNGGERKKYDIVMLMDIPTPQRFSGAYKEYIENAKHVIYIDHHPPRAGEWEEAQEQTGIDMKRIKSEKNALVCPSVPANTQLVAIIADKAGMMQTMFRNNLEKAKIFTAAIISGTSTDTGSFTRTANLLPEHATMPVAERPNFMPEGMSKMLVRNLEEASYNAGGDARAEIDKKWLREHITYDIPDEKFDKNLKSLSAREKMLTYALDEELIIPSLGLGFIDVDYNQMSDVWAESLRSDSSVTLLDVQNAFKYSEVMNGLRTNPEKTAHRDETFIATTLEDRAREVYESVYNDDKIAVLTIQDKQEGEVTEKSEIAEQNGLRFSFRSADGSTHAELLASLFGGGGHGGAAGGRIDLPGIKINSKLIVRVNGEPVYDPKVIYQELKRNYDINHDNRLSDYRKQELLKDIRVDFAPEGAERPQTARDIITNLVRCIRTEQDDFKAKTWEERGYQVSAKKASSR